MSSKPCPVPKKPEFQYSELSLKHLQMLMDQPDPAAAGKEREAPLPVKRAKLEFVRTLSSHMLSKDFLEG